MTLSYWERGNNLQYDLTERKIMVLANWQNNEKGRSDDFAGPLHFAP